MIKVVRSTIVEAPITQVWDVLRDFNGHDRWHPAVHESRIDDSEPSDKVGCVRRFRLADGSELTEKLLALSDRERSYRYCLLETPIPLLNYVAEVELARVTDGGWTFWRWASQFTVPKGQEHRLTKMVADNIYVTGFSAVKEYVAQQQRAR
ncbi:MAG: SRPBCC family protein [Hyphomicrobiaceae bacterium]